MNEDQLHAKCYLWFHESFPDLRGLLCYNLNNSRNKIQGMMDKAKGLQKGRSDLVFYFNSKAFMIELKTESGKQSKEQVEWQKKIENAGFKYFLCKDLSSFQNLINSILLDLKQ
jgi:hypothetical protein